MRIIFIGYQIGDKPGELAGSNKGHSVKSVTLSRVEQVQNYSRTNRPEAKKWSGLKRV
jgi:hypothetical protein